MSQNQFYGWYDDPSQAVDQPTYDPPHVAPCPFCGCKLTSDDIRTHSIMYIGGYANRSYYYRTHRTCAEKHGNQTMDGFIFDMIKRNGD
ncbi:MAG: hypothetical protein WDN46_10090 [Methylocella sp.]